ncbi:NAD-dependent dehydratase [Massilia sp. WF1]|uniref:NAD-dependent epimerase/dehydratase family protein n=1 Tax=unclassified Massilia TaxID=2609279 RepID=UPI00064982FB|nr:MULTISPECIES: NAD-dependent epimerase/dehydratase family protein [unclassified Massilia]ALK96145.1 NAD(P)-dependent oxidoreductase [Massilia sp. WG5]KLU34793.1 NAD-dependent dehydratase [Massilia sp. WF1]
MNTQNNVRFSKPRLLIVGCGDVGMRLLPQVTKRFRVFALTSQPARCAELRAAGAIPVVADLDRPETLRRLGRLAPRVLHLAPPPKEGALDLRTRNLTAILPEGARVVYISTTGVYGDRQGALIDETAPRAPRNARARRRVDAEQVLRAWAVAAGGKVAILRAPGIYAQDRLPLERLRQGTPALAPQDDVYTNHIHADDLARLALLALFRARPGRAYNASDDTHMKMGDYFDLVADAFGLPRAPRLPRAELARIVSPVQLSFMSESRRLGNRRIKDELRARLRHPRVEEAVRAMAQAQASAE